MEVYKIYVEAYNSEMVQYDLMMSDISDAVVRKRQRLMSCPVEHFSILA